MATPQQVSDYREHQARIAELVRQQVEQFFDETPDFNAPEFPDDLRGFLEWLVGEFGPMSATIAADFYDTLRGAAKVPGSYIAEPFDYDLGTLVSKIADWILGAPNPETMKSRASRRMSSTVMQFGRNTIADNTREDRAANVRFARVPSGAKTCAFCLMLAGRGAVYRSAASAQRRGIDSLEDKYHDDCDCQVVPIFEGQSLPYDAAKFENAYHAAAEKVEQEGGSRGDTSAILAKIRAQADVTDAHLDNPIAHLEPDRKVLAEITARDWSKLSDDAWQSVIDADSARLMELEPADDVSDAWWDAIAAEQDRREKLAARREKDRARAAAKLDSKWDEVARVHEERGLPDSQDGYDEAYAIVFGEKAFERYRRKRVMAELRELGIGGPTDSFAKATRFAYRHYVLNVWATQAEDDTRGAMYGHKFNKKGEKIGDYADSAYTYYDLWTMNTATARKVASKELRLWWDQNGRISYEAFVEGLLSGDGAGRSHREDFLQ